MGFQDWFEKVSLKDFDSSVLEVDSKIKKLTKSFEYLGLSKVEVDGLNDAMKEISRNDAFSELQQKLIAVGKGNQLNGLQEAMDRLEARNSSIKKITDSFSELRANISEGFGLKAAFEGLDQLEAATSQLTTLKTIQLTTGSSEAGMGYLGYAANQQDNKKDAIKMESLMVKQGMTDAQAADFLPALSQFASVQEFANGTNSVAAAQSALEMASMFKKTDSAQQMSDFLNDYNKALMLQSGDPSKFNDMLKSIKSSSQGMGVTDRDAMYMATLSSQMGMTGDKSGEKLADMMVTALPKVKEQVTDKSSEANKTLASLGMIDDRGYSKFFDGDGKDGTGDDLQGFMKTLYDKTKNMDQDTRVKTYTAVFGKDGGNMAQLLASDQGMRQQEVLAKRFDSMPDYKAMEKEYNDSPQGQVKKLKDNVETLKTDGLIALAKAFNPLLEGVNKFLEWVRKMTDEHPSIVKGVAAIIATTMAISGAVLVFGKLASSLLAIKDLGGGAVGAIKNRPGRRRRGGGEPPETGGNNPTDDTSQPRQQRESLLQKFKNRRNRNRNDSPEGHEDHQDQPGGNRRRRGGRGRGGGLVGNLLSGAVGGVVGAGLTGGIDLGQIKQMAMHFDVVRHAATLMGTSFGGTFQKLSQGLKSMNVPFKLFEGFLGNLGKSTTLWAVKMAAAWLIGLGPIGLIIAGVIAVVGALWVAWQNNFGNIREVATSIGKWITEHFEGVVNWFRGLPDRMMQIGSDIVHGLWSGIQKLGDWLMQKAVDFVDMTIPGPIRKFLGIASPSRLMKEHGRFVVEGLALGMTDNAKMVHDASKHMASKVTGPGREALAANLPSAQGGGGDIHVHVHPHPHQKSEEIADQVMRKLGASSRGQMLNTGLRVNISAM
ncbi:phage tail tape measure protein [Tumebacillus sp. ITR2]|uniref:Phage tail tape measure protein n=1 Tax=Tumebacillus amylolyticus TaxID=2801339 RepID=A0ABS1J7H3_9BACL|nr:phage tail tape measure protein [Tumebacillus amylolyticus]MBL0386229.1 phage tail tape measure protein [Tumebacillus amylolyticus]